MGDHQARKVSSTADLLSAVADESVREIRVTGPIASVPTLRLVPGQSLVGEGASARLAFAAGVDGVQLSRDNAVKALCLAADVDRRVVFNDSGQTTFGRIELEKLRVVGVVQLLAAEAVRAGHVEAHGIDIVAADARGFDRRPKGYGVEVVPGAFTLWNRELPFAVGSKMSAQSFQQFAVCSISSVVMPACFPVLLRGQFVKAARLPDLGIRHELLIIRPVPKRGHVPAGAGSQLGAAGCRRRQMAAQTR